MPASKGGVIVLIQYRPGGNYDVHHVMVDHIPDYFSQTRRDKGTRQTQQDGGPFLIRQHFFKNIGAEAHVAGLN